MLWLHGAMVHLLIETQYLTKFGTETATTTASDRR